MLRSYHIIAAMFPCLVRDIVANNCSASSYQYGAALSCSIFKRHNVCAYSNMSGHPEQVTSKRATFGMGCFWAGDSLFGALPGVIRTCVGYSGGIKESPVYKDIGDHTEVVDIEYNPELISYSYLLELFWNNHEYSLTSKVKRQYMSLILHHDKEQKSLATASQDLRQREVGEVFITEIRKFTNFYPAEDYHQKYRLQHHSWLLEAIGVTTPEALRTSPVAAKLNGYIAGAASLEQFQRELPRLGLSDKAEKYVTKYVIKNQGSGLYC